MREIVHVQIGHAGNNIGYKVKDTFNILRFVINFTFLVLGSDM